MSKTTNTKTDAFQTAIQKLEKTVTELEKGDLPIEAQLKRFEEGVALSRDCVKRLEDIERKVETLVEGPDGNLKTEAVQA